MSNYNHVFRTLSNSFRMTDLSYLRYLRPAWLTDDQQYYKGNAAFQDLLLSKNLEGMSIDLRNLLRNEDEGLATANARSQNPNPFTTWTVLTDTLLLSVSCRVEHDGNPDPPHCTVYPPMPYNKQMRHTIVQTLLTETRPFIGRRI